MNRTSVAIIAIVASMCLLAAGASAAAEWVVLGDNLYVDRASNSREGDLATVTVRLGNDAGDSRQLTFDCARSLYLPGPDPFGGAQRPTESVDRYHRLALALSIACRRIWELWK
jgi:hypothetical protein